MNLRAIAIDDDPIVTLTVEKLASLTHGVELVNTFNCPIAGAASIILDRPDIVFLDMEMPELSGLDIMNALVRHPYFIVISGNASFRSKVMQLNAVDFITKPAQAIDFRKAVEKVQFLVRDSQLSI